jgi:hypothetical protein
MLRKYYRLTAQRKAAGLNTLVSIGFLAPEVNNRNSNSLQKINTIYGILFYLGQSSKYVLSKR